MTSYHRLSAIVCLGLLYILSHTCSVQAQNISKAEYFVDVDPGLNNGLPIPIGSGTDVTASFQVPINSIGTGFHQLFVRAYTNPYTVLEGSTNVTKGGWSLTNTRNFYKEDIAVPQGGTAPDIVSGEFFIDTDPGLGQGLPIPLTPGENLTNVGFVVDITGITDGFHLLYARFKNAAGHWSLTSSRVMYKQNFSTGSTSTPDIVAGEYFIDTDPGLGIGTTIPITAGPDLTNVNFLVDISGITDGFHLLYARFKDATGQWSLTTNRVMYKQNLSSTPTTTSPVVGGEYFIDTDPGFGAGSPITLSQSTNITNLNFLVDITAVSDGFHNLSSRFKDALGRWSLTATRSFYKQELQVPGQLNVPIVKMEQFLDTDPGFGNATDVPITPGLNITVNFLVDLTGQSIGNHRLYVRALDANGKWSLVHNAFINVCTPATLSETHTNQSNCNTNDGSINLTVTGGTAPVTYLWSNGATTKDISNLAPGTYTVTVTDAQPCPATLTVTILPATIISLAKDSVNTSCGASNGSAGITVTGGGTAPYTFLWNTGATTSTISGLAAGTYSVTVTDANLCIATREFDIKGSLATPNPVLTVTQPVDPCTSTATTINSSAAGSYLWNTGATTQNIVVTTSGTYSVTISENGCTATDSVAVIVSGGNQSTLGFSGAAGFTNTLVNPGGSVPSATYLFEVKYTNSAGIKPSPFYPQVLLDFQGNGTTSDPNDLVFYMQEKDPADQNVIDGKDYYYEAQGLPESRNYTTRVVVNDQGGCSTTFGPFAGPRPLSTADVSIFANDISFSNPTPAINSTITVYATIHNNTGNDADNFVVHLINQFTPGVVYPDIIVPHLSSLPPNNTVQVSWQITTPAIPAWCPMQVVVDYTNVLPEPNELDNQAIRPFVNGNFILPGDIGITAAANPLVSRVGSIVTIAGRSYYRNTALQLADSSCAGATVKLTIQGTQQIFTGYTDAFGNYAISFEGPSSPGVYHAKLDITDYTLDGDTATTFTMIPIPPCSGPNLVGELILNPGLTYDPNINVGLNILAGDTIGGSFFVRNVGDLATATSSLVQFNLAGGSVVPGPYTIPILQPGESFTIQLPSIRFNNPITTFIQATVDFNNVIVECGENNTVTRSIRVLPAKPDIIAYSNISTDAKQCLLNTIGFQLSNGGGIATGDFNAHLVVKLGTSTMAVLNQLVSSIPAQSPGGVLFNYTPPQPGLYQYFLYCDTLPNAVDELSETNNNATAEILVTGCQPDLYVFGCGSLDVKPKDPEVPGNITIYATVGNGGLSTAYGPFRVKFLAAAVPYFVTVTDSIPVGTNKQISVTIPATAYGDNQLVVTADVDSAMAEVNETNNDANGSLCTNFALTNLNCLREEIIKTQQAPGLPATMATGLFNLGLYEASNAEVQFEVSGPGITGWQNLGFVKTFIDNTCSCPLYLRLPGQFVYPQIGIFQVRITADFNNLYTECNEANNVLIVPVTVAEPVPGKPDYVVRSENIAPSLLNPDENEVVTIDITYKNQATADTDSLEIFTQVDNQPLDSTRGRGLGSNQTNTVRMNNTWSSNIRGVHVIRAVADNDNEIIENNENNNEATRAIVVGKAPNLNFTFFKASDTLPNIGGTITVAATIKNDGFVNSLTTYQLFYKDNSGAEVLVGQRTLTVDSAGSKTVTIPWLVIDPATTLTGRLSNTIPVEYNLLDNEVSVEIGRMIATVSATSAACITSGNGVARVAIKGGVTPYNILWSNGFAGDSIIALPGTYGVLIADAEGTLLTDSAVIGAAAVPPVVSFTGLAANYISTAAAVTLTGNPVGGLFSGPGITGNQFNPAIAGVGGPYAIIYTYTSPEGCVASDTAITSVSAPSGNVTISINPQSWNLFFCQSAGFGIAYTATGIFNAGNIFTAQLSDANGSFANPVAIGSTASIISGTIQCDFVNNPPAGTGYRIRIVSSNPAAISPDNGTDFEIRENINYYRDLDADGFGDPGVQFQNCFAIPGYVTNNTDCDDNNASIFPSIPAITINAIPGNTICTGTAVTFTAQFSNAGVSPSFQWKKNGNNVGTNSSTYTDALLSDNDIIECILTSNAVCVINATAPSNSIVMQVSVLPIVSAGSYSTVPLNNPVVVLTGSPAGGIFTGTGVTGNVFEPSVAGIGTFTISYLYTDGITGCSKTDSTTIEVTPPCIFSVDTLAGPRNACAYMAATGVYATNNATYSVTATSASTYNWILPAGATIVSGTNTSSLIQVHFAANFVSGTIAVTVSSLCGDAPVTRTQLITKAMPAVPAAITGVLNACPFIGTNTPITYAIVPVTGALTYRWTLPSTVTLLSASPDSTSITITFNTGFDAGTNKSIKVKSVSGCGTSADRTLNISVTKPATPALISGPKNACIFIGTANEATYITRPVLNATSYKWTVPAGATITSHPNGSGANDTIITVLFDNSFVSPSNISVQSVSGCGLSASRTYAVTRTIPSTPGGITGTADVCPLMGTAITAAYSIRKVANATYYNWAVPAGAVATHPNGSGENDTIIVVSFDNNFTSGSISVNASNGCGNSLNRSYLLRRNIPPTPGVITGITDPCPFLAGIAVNYTIRKVLYATSYTWSVPAGVTITGHPGGAGINDTSISVSFDNTFTTGNISVIANNNCASSLPRSLALIRRLPATPGTITGATDPCPFIGTADAVYSVRKVLYATSYTWSVPAGVTITGHPGGAGINDTSISVSFDNTFTTGNISVIANNNCASSLPRSLALIRKLPATPGTITGPTDPCPFIGLTSVTYTIRKVLNATSYTWQVPAGAAITGHPGGTGINDTIITVTFSSTIENGNIAVVANNSCTASLPRTLTLVRRLPAIPGNITTSVLSTTCNSRQYYYAIPALPANATSVAWIVPAGGTIVSQGTLNIIVEYGPAAVSDTLRVAALNNCARSAENKLFVNLNFCGPIAIAANAVNPQSLSAKTGIPVEMEVSVFPNPSSSSFSLQFSSGLAEKAMMRLVDISGREVSKKLVIEKGVTRFGNELQQGIYFIEVRQGKQTKIIKIIKL